MNPKTLASLLGLAFALTLFSGCASVGTKFDMTQVQNLQKGVTSRAEMEKMFGKPMNVSLMPDGRVMAMWFYSKATSGARNFVPVVNMVSMKVDSNTQTLQAIFTADGVLETFTTNDANSTIKAGLAG